LGEKCDCPHDVATSKAEDQSASPYRLIFALGTQKPRAEAEGHDDHESDKEGPAVRHVCFPSSSVGGWNVVAGAIRPG